jgi:hypothetical protein
MSPRLPFPAPCAAINSVAPSHSFPRLPMRGPRWTQLRSKPMRRVLPTILSLVLLACNGVPSEPSVALVPEARAAAPSSAPVPATSSGTPSTRPPPIAIGSEPIPVGTRITTTHRSKLSLHLLLGGTRSTQTHDLRFVHRSELLRAGPEDLTFRLSVLEQIVPSEAPGTPAHGPLEGKTYVLRCGRDGHVRVTPPVPSTGGIRALPRPARPWGTKPIAARSS